MRAPRRAAVQQQQQGQEVEQQLASRREERAQSSVQHTTDPNAPFVWTKQWYPVLPLAYLDPRRPNGPIEILGHSYVAWFDAAARRWRAFEDRCPHRMARLSQGRVAGGGAVLQCSYHGWEFDGAGACTRIPQVRAQGGVVRR